MNKTDAYNEFDPTRLQGTCEGKVGFDIETLTWKKQRTATVTDS